MGRGLGGYLYKVLRSSGMLNEEAGDLGSLITTRPELRALCFSRECVGSESRRYRLIEAARDDQFCPHCGHALVWKAPRRLKRREISGADV